MTDTREMLVAFMPTCIAILVPKSRGKGFLRVPLGHHANALSTLAYDIGYDLFGLDGALDVMTGYIPTKDRDMMIERVVSPIAELLGFPYRVVSEDEFWDHHPDATKRVVKDDPDNPFFRY